MRIFRRKKIWALIQLIIVIFLIKQPFALADNSRFELPAVLRQVQAYNPALLAARHELDAAREQYPQALAGWRPTLEGSASLYTTEIDSSNFSQGTGATTKSLSLDATQPLFRGGRTFAETKSAKSAIAAAEARLDSFTQDLMLETIATYMDVINNRRLLGLQVENEKLLQEQARIAEEKYKAGLETKTSKALAASALARGTADRIRVAGALHAADKRFEELVGYPPQGTLYIPDTPPGLTGAPDDMVTAALAHSPDLKAARYSYQASTHNADATFRELFPRISAFASYEKEYDPQPGITSDSEVQTLGLRASVPFYQGGATRSRIRQARATTARREALVSDIQAIVTADVQSTWELWRATQSELTYRLKEADEAGAVYEGMREEYRMGERPLEDVLDRAEDLLNIQKRVNELRREHIIYAYQLALDTNFIDLPLYE